MVMNLVPLHSEPLIWREREREEGERGGERGEERGRKGERGEERGRKGGRGASSKVMQQSREGEPGNEAMLYVSIPLTRVKNQNSAFVSDIGVKVCL